MLLQSKITQPKTARCALAVWDYSTKSGQLCSYSQRVLGQKLPVVLLQSWLLSQKKRPVVLLQSRITLPTMATCALTVQDYSAKSNQLYSYCHKYNRRLLSKKQPFVLLQSKINWSKTASCALTVKYYSSKNGQLCFYSQRLIIWKCPVMFFQSDITRPKTASWALTVRDYSSKNGQLCSSSQILLVQKRPAALSAWILLMFFLTDELKKILVALKDGDEKSALSPESLFQAIWKVN